jgi:pilus assembly protein CpaB
MQGKPMVMLAVAVVMGLGAMLMTNQLLSQPKKTEEATREVLVAVRDLKEEEVIKADMFKFARMAVSAVPAGAFTTVRDVVGRWVRTPVLEGEPIIERKLGAKGTPPGLVANIPKGMRAFTVNVDEQSGVSGFILPNHRVDVIKFETGDHSQKRGETILQNVQVLAAGQVFVTSEERSLQSRTVTLAVRPEDVAVLVAAKAKGTLSLALRGVSDHDVVEGPRSAPDDGEEKKRRMELEETVAQLKRELQAKKDQSAKRVPAPVVSHVGVIYRSDRSKREEYPLGGQGSQPSLVAPPPPPQAEPSDAPETETSPSSVAVGPVGFRSGN